MIHRILLALFLGLAFARGAFATDERAVEAYRRGDLASARTEWLEVLDDPTHAPQGFERARILYDLGNVAYREGRTLEAVGWYTASLRLRPRDADTWNNLEEARSRAKLEPADRGDLSSTLRRLVHSFTAAEARWLALSGLLVVAAALAYEALRGGRMARWLAWGAVGFAGLVTVPCVVGWLGEDDRPLIVVQADGAALRSEPRPSAATTSDLPAGEVVEHLDDLPDWTKVRTPSGVEGWVAHDALFALRR